MEPDYEAAARYMHGEREPWQSNCSKLEVVGLRKASEDTARLHIAGRCPVCGHHIRKRIDSADTIAFFRSKGSLGMNDILGKRYLLTCNCAYAHEGAPDGVRGCGAQGAVTVSSVDGTAAVSYCSDVDVPTEERDADEWIERAAGRQLQRLRNLAGQWVSMLGVVTGFVTVGTIFDFTANDLELQGTWLVAYLLAAAAAVAGAVVAVTFASQAAGLRQLNDVPAEVDERSRVMREARVYCRRRLSWSRWAALVAMLLLIVAVAVRFLGEG
jgi:hypothetical protein